MKLSAKKKRKKKRKFKSEPGALPKSKVLKPGEFVTLPGGLIIGEIPISKIKQRKVRFRKMDSLQVRALRSSIERLGVKDPIFVLPDKKGNYELIDGHHRLDEAPNQDYDSLPAIVLTDKDGKLVSKREADLSMSRFNITANYDGEAYLEYLHEMAEDGISLEDIALATAKEEEAIQEMVSAFVADMEAEQHEDEDEEDEEEGSKGTRYDTATSYGAAEQDRLEHGGQDFSRGQPIFLSLPGTDEVRLMLHEAVEMFGAPTNAEGVVEALRAVTGRKTEEEE